MRVKMVAVDKVIPYDRNPRSNKQAIPTVMASLKEYGWQQPIVVDKDSVIVVGHTRFAAALQLGHEKVPVVVADQLTEAQIKAYRIMDNRAGERASWDDELLALELSDLSDMGDASDKLVEMTGLDDAKIKDLLGIPEGNQNQGDAPTDGDLEGQWDVVVACADEDAQTALLERLMGEGYDCRAII